MEKENIQKMLEDDNLSHLKGGLTDELVESLPPMASEPKCTEETLETMTVEPGSPRSMHDVDLLETSAGGDSANKIPSASAVTAPRRRKSEKIPFDCAQLGQIAEASSEASSFHSADPEDDPEAVDEDADVEETCQIACALPMEKLS
eukprot:6491684-Amphidinium_carterae.5